MGVQVCKHNCDVLDSRVFLRNYNFTTTIEVSFPCLQSKGEGGGGGGGGSECRLTV